MSCMLDCFISLPIAFFIICVFFPSAAAFDGARNKIGNVFGVKRLNFNATMADANNNNPRGGQYSIWWGVVFAAIIFAFAFGAIYCCCEAHRWGNAERPDERIPLRAPQPRPQHAPSVTYRARLPDQPTTTPLPNVLEDSEPTSSENQQQQCESNDDVEEPEGAEPTNSEDQEQPQQQQSGSDDDVEKPEGAEPTNSEDQEQPQQQQRGSDDDVEKPEGAECSQENPQIPGTCPPCPPRQPGNTTKSKSMGSFPSTSDREKDRFSL